MFCEPEVPGEHTNEHVFLCNYNGHKPSSKEIDRKVKNDQSGRRPKWKKNKSGKRPK
jgi:hypothetical protein